MEALAAWVPTTPELEVKLLFGAHIWDTAQHADAFGKRAHELRLPLQHSTEPSSDYVDILDELSATSDTAERIGAFYDALLPDLVARFNSYLDRVDHLLDAPTVRIIERIVNDVSRMTAESRSLREELPSVRLDDDSYGSRLLARLTALGDVVRYRSALSTEAQPA